MSNKELEKLANEILTLIEIDEARLLNWGFVEVRSNLEVALPTMLESLPSDSLVLQLWQQAQSSGQTDLELIKGVIVNLKERKLIFRLPENYYRTRFAETVRLLNLLRQRFNYDDWNKANKLVSDMRIQLQRRRYPKRDVNLANLLTKLSADSQLNLSPLQTKVIELLLQQNDQSLELAAFQVEAISLIFNKLNQSVDSAIAIGAGTGAGKTKAFYIPALAALSEMVAANEYWTKALALYPRVELLKDQLAELLSEAGKLQSLLKESAKRPIVVGAYYGDTPNDASDEDAKFIDKNWKLNKTNDGWICPFLSCPDCSPPASRELVWYKTDIQQARQDTKKFARLKCPDCDFTIGSERLLLTRKQMQTHPPDVLFTTTEMLNKGISNIKEHTLFGIDSAIRNQLPRLVLLDEIHTYDNLFGSQVAFLLRRWKQARSQRRKLPSLCFVGLSATLTNAESFFSSLTGVAEHQVTYVSPSQTDLIEEGLEYNLVLKGDPVSITSLLSTSVQTGMLLGRMLDPRPASGKTHTVSNETYGQKIFAFTDKLDVINRWYHIEEDAETQKNLSKFRELPPTATLEERRQRDQAGQDWSRCIEVGHNLKAPMRLDLVSSQNRGVDSKANFVIATSTLEVGFNDPAVGAVIQHKAPRSMASFLQRKGRAGRVRQMRPWTVVITSAYGRDRWAFQHAEALFDPTLPPINLPLNNYYVRKIQAAYVLIDWLALKLKRHNFNTGIDVWNLLANFGKESPYSQTEWARGFLVTLLEKLLSLRSFEHDEFKVYLEQALALPNNEAAVLLWAEPRSLMFEVIPTLLRQLESNWQQTEFEEQSDKPLIKLWKDSIAPNHPLPNFVPKALFTDLNLPELIIHLPENSNGQTMREDQNMALLMGLTEFAPGHVSKRFSRPNRSKEAHWLQIPKNDSAYLSLKELKIQFLDTPKIVRLLDKTYQVYRPLTYTLDIIPSKVKSTSRGRLDWRSEFVPKASYDQSEAFAIPLQLIAGSKWTRFFRNIEAFLHSNNSWVEITRLAVGVEVSTRLEGQTEQPPHYFSFGDAAQATALGFVVYADALRFEIAPLEIDQVLNHPNWTTLYRHFGPSFFLYKLNKDARLRNLSSFEREWLWQLESSMLIATAIALQCDLRTAALKIHEPIRLDIAKKALKVIFQSQRTQVEDNDEEDEDEEGSGRLVAKLQEYIMRSEIREALAEHEVVLWNGEDTDLEAWLRESYASSLGATLFAALTQLIPDLDPDSLVMDVVHESNHIWISETTPGGVGLVAKIAEALALQPRSFDLQMLDTLQNCDLEQRALQLHAVADLVSQNETSLIDAFKKIRTSTDLPNQLKTQHTLADVLEKQSIPITRELIVALNTKFLRPNSGPDSDQLLAMLVQRWQEEEARLGIVIDLRVMSVAAARLPDILSKVEEVLERIAGVNDANAVPSQIFNLLQSLLWLSCDDSCPECIKKAHPFQELAQPSRALLLTLLDLHPQPLLYDSPGWRELVQQKLAQEFVVQLRCEQNQLVQCKQHLLDLLTEPIEIGFQKFFPVLDRIIHKSNYWLLDLTIQELIYA